MQRCAPGDPFVAAITILVSVVVNTTVGMPGALILRAATVCTPMPVAESAIKR